MTKKIDINLFSSNLKSKKPAILVKLSDCISNIDPSSYIPSGSFSLDWATGRPGIRKMSAYTLLGDSGTIKSYIAGEFIKGCINYNQATFNEPGIALVFDSESSYTPDWLEQRGIDPALIMTCKFFSIEEMATYYADFLDSYNKLIAERTKDIPFEDIHKNIPILCLVFDTISMICTDDDNKGSARQASAAVAMSKFVRILSNSLMSANMIILFAYQEKTQLKLTKYEKDDINKLARGIKPARFMSNAIYRMKLKKKSSQTRYCEVKMEKNRLNPQNEGKKSIVSVNLTKGINDVPAIIEAACEIGLLNPIGSRYVLPDSKKKLTALEAANIVWPDVKREVFGEQYNPYIFDPKALDIDDMDELFIDNKKSMNEEDEEELSELDPGLM